MDYFEKISDNETDNVSDQINEENNVSEHDFFSSFEKDVKEVPEQEPIHTQPDGAQVEVKPSRTAAEIRQAKTKTSKFVINYLDKAIKFTCGVIADEEETDDFGADEEEKKELADHLADMLPDDLEGIPAWMKFTISASVIYGTAIGAAFKMKKDKKRQSQLRITNYELQKETNE